MNTIANKIVPIVIILGVLIALTYVVYEPQKSTSKLKNPTYNYVSFDRALFTNDTIMNIGSDRYLIVLDEVAVHSWLNANGTKVDIHQLTAINHGAMGCTSSLMIIYSER